MQLLSPYSHDLFGVGECVGEEEEEELKEEDEEEKRRRRRRRRRMRSRYRC